MENYPPRVTLFEDGVYRWSYDMDMWQNRFLLRLIVRLFCFMLGIPTLFVLAMVLKQAVPLMNEGVPMAEITGFFVRNDLILLGVVGGLWIGMILLTLIVYAVCAAFMHGVWRMCFEMDDASVTLVRSAAAKNVTDTLSAVAAVTEIAVSLSGKNTHGNTAALRGASGPDATGFESVSRVTLHPEDDVINLREFFIMHQVYVGAEDYSFVRDFISERVREKARP